MLVAGLCIAGTDPATAATDHAVDAVVDRFPEHDPVSDDGGAGRWLVRYDGSRYWVDLDYPAFVVGK